LKYGDDIETEESSCVYSTGKIIALTSIFTTLPFEKPTSKYAVDGISIEEK